MSQTPNLFLSVGKQVKDEYGRVIGKIASFAVTPRGKFEDVFVERGDGKFSKHSVDYLKVDGSEITLLSEIKSDACILCEHIPLLWRKDQALGDLYAKKKIEPELYNQLHTAFAEALTQLKSDAHTLQEDTDKEITRCWEEIKALNYALVHIEIEHEIGKMDDQSYGTAFSMIQDNLKKINIEKSDLEVTRKMLSNTLLGDKPGISEKATSKPAEATSKTSSTVYAPPELPEPPVVVYVKEIGKTGI
ncbi:MAG TPA: CdvA-like protein [Candidatus Acidoferrum sp.]|nr:CdvA-like protein [Candidatus Acidoferrum sp.]